MRVEGGDCWREEGECFVSGLLCEIILWYVGVYCRTGGFEIYRYQSEGIAALCHGCELVLVDWGGKEVLM